jgi:hypothetical protein
VECKSIGSSASCEATRVGLIAGVGSVQHVHVLNEIHCIGQDQRGLASSAVGGRTIGESHAAG